jgi:hypothetical protein
MCSTRLPKSRLRNFRLVGLALSGGGIRSATFNLGLMQEMGRLGVLKVFDYVSTVSGGGFTGGWWSAWLSRKNHTAQTIFPAPEKVEPERWADYAVASGTKMPDASLSAARRDPIHHLRLFANYLTPRKGFLSADTWRAGTIVLRNLILTWLVLLPLLLATVLAGQVFFTLNTGKAFVGGKEPTAEAKAASPAARAPDAGRAAKAARVRQQSTSQAGERAESIRDRASVALRPLLVLLSWTVFLTWLWILYGPSGPRSQLLMTTIGTVVAGASVYVLWKGVTNDSGGGWAMPRGWLVAAVVGAVALVVSNRLIPPGQLFSRRGRGEREVPMYLLRNRVDRVHTMVLVALGATTVVLLVAGFSHDLVWYVFDPASGGARWVKQAGGWTAVLGSVAAVLFTGIRGAPSGGDGGSKSEPGLKSQLVYAVAPMLAVIMLAIVASTAGRHLIRELGVKGDLPLVDGALLLSAGLILAFAVYEVQDGDEQLDRGKQWWAVLLATAAGVAAFLLAQRVTGVTLRGVVPWLVGTGALLLFRWMGLARDQSGAAARSSHAKEPAEERRWRVAKLLPLAAALLLAGWAMIDPAFARKPPAMGLSFPYYNFLLAGIVFCGVCALAEYLLARSRRSRALALVTVAFLALGARLLFPFLSLPAGALLYSSSAVSLTLFALAWVVGLGWMADPNLT